MKLGVATAVAVTVVACGVNDPLIPLNANTTRVCWDSTVCPTWEACPNYSTPGRCEQGGAPPEQFGYKSNPYIDAGAPAGSR